MHLLYILNIQYGFRLHLIITLRQVIQTVYLDKVEKEWGEHVDSNPQGEG